MEGHIFFLHLHRLHRMQVRYEQLLYHLSELHIHHIQHRMLSCAVLQLHLLHTDTVAGTLFLPVLFPCKSQGSRKPVFLLLQVFQELCPAMHMPCNIHFRRLLLLLHNPLSGLRKVQGSMEVSTVLLSMQGYKHPHLLL